MIERGEEKTVHVLGEELLNQLDLLGTVVFLEGTLPYEFHSLFIRGFSGPLFYRFPKGMGGPLGNHGDDRRPALPVFRSVRGISVLAPLRLTRSSLARDITASIACQ